MIDLILNIVLTVIFVVVFGIIMWTDSVHREVNK